MVYFLDNPADSHSRSSVHFCISWFAVAQICSTCISFNFIYNISTCLSSSLQKNTGDRQIQGGLCRFNSMAEPEIYTRGLKSSNFSLFTKIFTYVKGFNSLYIIQKKFVFFLFSLYNFSTNYKGDLASLLVQLNPLLRPLTTCTYEEKTKRRTYNKITLILNRQT